jgi:hypothetical protein
MIRQEAKVGTCGELAKGIKGMLRLRSTPVTYRRQDRAEDLDQLKSLQRLPHLTPFCQSLFMARVQEGTLSTARDDKLGNRCMQIDGLKTAMQRRTREGVCSGPVYAIC